MKKSMLMLFGLMTMAFLVGCTPKTSEVETPVEEDVVVDVEEENFDVELPE
jgi:hypothetical protein